MKIVLGLVSTAALALVLGGCGSSSSGGDGFGPDPDVTSVQNRFDKPDGTFSAGNAADVFKRGMDGSSSAAGLDFSGSSGSSSGGSVTKKNVGLHVLDAASGSSSPFHCIALQSGQESGSCDCPAGGSIDYAVSSSGAQGGERDGLLKFRLNACATGDAVIDGSEYIDIRTDTSDQAHPLYSLLFLVDATVTKAGVAHHVDVQARYSNGAAEIAVKVDDGWVVVSIKSSANGESGSWSVRDKNGSWTCTETNGHGTCSNDKGEKRSF